MGNPVFYDGAKTGVEPSLVNMLCSIFAEGLPFAAPASAFKTNETELVRSVLRMLQGFSSSLFYWDDGLCSFHIKSEIFLTHLSQTSLRGILSQFVYGATCLQSVELFVKKVEISSLRSPPTLKAFVNSVSIWLERLRDIALKEEMKCAGSDDKTTVTLLGLSDVLASLCSGAELLLQVVHGAIPSSYFNSDSSPAGETAVHILDYLYNKLNDVCLVQGGEEEAYHMLLFLFIGTLLPYVEGLDSWLYDGTLDDPFEEMFFYANKEIAIDQPAFWEKSYLLRPLRNKKSGSGSFPVANDGKTLTGNKREMGDRQNNFMSSSARVKNHNDMDVLVCPMFMKDIARAIVSSGKSLQLIRHVPTRFDKCKDYENHGFGRIESPTFASQSTTCRNQVGAESEHFSFLESDEKRMNGDFISNESAAHGEQIYHTHRMGELTLSEVVCVSLAGLLGDGSHISRYFEPGEYPWTAERVVSKYHNRTQTVEKENYESATALTGMEKIWCRFLRNKIQDSRKMDTKMEKAGTKCATKGSDGFGMKELRNFTGLDSQMQVTDNCDMEQIICTQSFWPENPVIAMCKDFLNKNRDAWDKLNLSRNFYLPPLDDDNLREAIFGGNSSDTSTKQDDVAEVVGSISKGTNYAFGFSFGQLRHLSPEDDRKALEVLFPFPTLLPCFKENLPISELLPSLKNSTLASRVLNWVKSAELKAASLPAVIIQECLIVYIKKQVDYVGKHILFKMMNGWRLMEELGVVRAIYLLGSGDLLQQFLIVLFDKLDKGDSWDDDFELNTVLQESIRNSADGMLLSAPDSLVVSIVKPHGLDDDKHTDSLPLTPHKVRQSFGIDALDSLKFTYKVSWPLELIANLEAIEKYNQVMSFLLKVKRAKFCLDKARRWTWKDAGSKAINRKHHLLVEQKLLHFVDVFHQYVMDRVFHSAWLELCEGMASATSLDEVIEVHEAYLLSIQRQCFVAPDKLSALTASRVKSILGLALDFYSMQQMLCSGGAAPAIKARCEVEVERIEKKFDDCVAFLLRILSFKLNVPLFPHLADLITRINYNYFYMSDSGSLSTVPGSEPKPGKSFPTRPDL